MPTVVNGIGTWYYGRDRIHTLRGVCDFCRATGDLTSYDTTTYFTVFFVPIIPLGKKRILSQCGRCRKHRVVNQRDWQAAKDKDSATVLAKLQADPSDREAIQRALALATTYQDQNLFDRVADSLASHRTDDAEIQSLLGRGYEYFSRNAEAEAAFRNSLRAADTPEGRETLGINLLKQGRPQDAEQCLAQCYDSPEGAGTLYWLVSAYQAQGQHEDALRVIDAVVAKWPDLATNKSWSKLQQTSSKYRASSKRIAAPLLGASTSAGYRDGGWRSKAPRYVLPALLLAAFLIYLGVAIHRGHSRTVYVQSGVSKPYVATINGVDHPVGPGRPFAILVPEGDITVAIKAPGIPPEQSICRIETSFWSRPFVNRTFVLNPDQVAVLTRETTVYSKQPMPFDEPDDMETGKLLHEFRDIDYEFAPFPKSITVKSDRITKHRVDLFVVPDAETRLQIASKNRTLPELQDYARRWLMFQPDDSSMLIWLASKMDGPTAETFFKARLAERPVLTEWHRAYQVAMERGQPDRDLIPEYRALVAETGRSPDAVYLLARLCPHDECLKLLGEAAARHPPSHLAENALGYHALAEGRFDDAVRWCQRAVTGAHGNPFFDHEYEQTLWATRNYRRLLQLADTRLASHPNSVTDLLQKARILVALRDTEAAKASFNQAFGQLNAVAGGPTLVPGLAFNVCDALMKRDAAAYVTAITSGGQATFPTALLNNQPEAAIDQLQEDGNPNTTVHYGLIYLCAQRNGKTEVAERALAKYLTGLRLGGRDERAFAGLLSGKGPSAEQVKLLAMEPAYKRVAVAVAIRKYPQLSAELAPLAWRLNFEFDADGLCLQKELPPAK